ncbi:Uncharacterized protein APZ42_028424 [Daphnia magna]|uniref:Uncharacterized protein n=1 Tax=Daphnia magna TaxID=35525 RepID=A0A164QIK0_9CRUS|nr:Uncharacterized protein APZ42_028424 [Daphnia magna]
MAPTTYGCYKAGQFSLSNFFVIIYSPFIPHLSCHVPIARERAQHLDSCIRMDNFIYMDSSIRMDASTDVDASLLPLVNPSMYLDSESGELPQVEGMDASTQVLVSSLSMIEIGSTSA